MSFLTPSLKQEKSITKANLNFISFNYLLRYLFYVWEAICANAVSIGYLGNQLILTRMITFTFLILDFKQPHIFCFEIWYLYSCINMWSKKTPTKQIKKTHQNTHFSVSVFVSKMSLVWYTVFIQPSKIFSGRKNPTTCYFNSLLWLRWGARCTDFVKTDLDNTEHFWKAHFRCIIVFLFFVFFRWHFEKVLSHLPFYHKVFFLRLGECIVLSLHL